MIEANHRGIAPIPLYLSPACHDDEQSNVGITIAFDLRSTLLKISFRSSCSSVIPRKGSGFQTSRQEASIPSPRRGVSYTRNTALPRLFHPRLVMPSSSCSSIRSRFSSTSYAQQTEGFTARHPLLEFISPLPSQCTSKKDAKEILIGYLGDQRHVSRRRDARRKRNSSAEKWLEPPAADNFASLRYIARVIFFCKCCEKQCPGSNNLILGDRRKFKSYILHKQLDLVV